MDVKSLSEEELCEVPGRFTCIFFISLFLLHLFFFSCIFFVWTVENGGFDCNKKRGFYFVPKALYVYEIEESKTK